MSQPGPPPTVATSKEASDQDRNALYPAIPNEVVVDRPQTPLEFSVISASRSTRVRTNITSTKEKFQKDQAPDIAIMGYLDNHPSLHSQKDFDQADTNSSTSNSREEDSSSYSNDDIGIFQQPSFSSEEAWEIDPPDLTSQDVTHTHKPLSETSSSAASFNSELSMTSEDTQDLEKNSEHGQAKPDNSHITTKDSNPNDNGPALISQDPGLLASWKRLFTSAPRLPTNLREVENQEPKYQQVYLDLIDKTPNKVFGDPMTQKKEELCRLYFVNINGISAANEFLAFQDALESLLGNGVDIFGLSETNLDWL
jgi:hypothetical protein